MPALLQRPHQRPERIQGPALDGRRHGEFHAAQPWPEIRPRDYGHGIPTNYDGSDLKLVVVPEKDSDWTNNEFLFNFGYPDLVVENGAISPNGTITAAVTNKGYRKAENVKVSIYLFDGEDVLVSEIPVGNIERGASSNISYRVDATLLVSDSYINYRSFKIEASGDQAELNYANDNQSVLFAPIRVSGITLSLQSSVLAVGDSMLISSEVSPTNATDKRIYWFTSDDHVATVDSDGKVTGVGLGTATIKAITTDGRFEDICAVTVAQTVPVTGIQMRQTTAKILEGQTRQLIATVLPENATNKTIVWSSGDTSIATVNSSGIVTAKKSGTVRITAKTADGNYQAVCTVTVTKSTIAVTGVSISDIAVSMEIGATKQLVATILPANATNYNVSWSSSDSSVASVNSSGLITANKAGTAIITVTTADGGYKATCQITVTTPTVAVTGIAVSPSELDMNVGEKKTLSAEVFPANASNKAVIWESGNSDVAIVSSSGLVTAIAEGTTYITATTKDGNYLSRCKVTVGESASPGLTPSVAIKNYTETTEVAYKTTIVFSAETGNLPDGAIVQWFKDDVLVETGEKCTIKTATNNYTIQAKIIQNGRVIAESKKETVKVKNGFFARLIAFFRGLFGRLPVIEQ